ncbi:MAG: PQQ-binding-like beta-propeller repeat protein [Phycisphaerales bacterium]|nr:PQQ-binding-like beta-propeller repeat protein [Phycisphaerales bacterium]
MIKHLWIVLVSLCFVVGCAHRPVAQLPEPALIPANSFMSSWSADLGNKQGRIEQIFVRDNLLIAYTDQHYSYALNRANGDVKRMDRINSPHDPIFPPLVNSTQIIYPTHMTLEIYTRDSGEHRSLDLQERISTPAVRQEDMLYFGIANPRGGRIMAADISQNYGFKTWEVYTQGDLQAAPALYSDLLYFGSIDHHVYAVTTDRTAAWPMEMSRFDAGGRITSDVVADDYAVYVTVANGTLYALDRSNGRMKWQYFAASNLPGHAVIGASLVYLYVPDTGLVAIDKMNGELTRQGKWVVPQGRQVLTEDATRVYLRGQDNSILAVDKQSGKIIFQSAHHDYTVFATDLSTPIIYAADRNGRVYAITPVTGVGEMGYIAQAMPSLLLNTAQQ